MERFVVVDLETTGHSPKYGNEIIEIGIVVIENRKIITEYSSKVKPKQKIPAFIKKLTGIDDEAVKDAPTFKEIVPNILPYFDDCLFVAHHVQFDYEFLNNALNKEGFGPIFCPTIDTVELARIFFPKADGYKLSDITAHLNIEHLSPHRALSDAYVTAQLFIKILEKIETLPYETLKQLEPLMYDLQSDFSIIYPLLIEEQRNRYKQRFDLISQHGFSVRKLSHVNSKDSESIIIDESFSQFLQRFYAEMDVELRQEQIHMAEHVHSTINQKEKIIIEAGTGIGKTIAYLLPSVYQAFKYNKKSIISTNTIQLQHQLMNNDRALIEKWLKTQVDVVLLKSPSHYIHLGKLRQFMDNFQDHNYDIVLSLAIIIVWLTETETGDYDEIQLPSNGEDIWMYISGYDTHQEDIRTSYFNLALERAKEANIIIVNHAYLLSNIFNSLNRVPSYQYLIVDEAHRFEEVARKQLSYDLDYVTFVHLLNDINKLFNHVSIEDLKNMADLFHRSIYQAVLFLHTEEDNLSETGKIQITIDQHYLKLLLNGEILDHLNDLLLSLKYMIAEMGKIKLKDEWKKGLLYQFIKDLNEYKERLEKFFDERNELVRTIEIDQYGAKNAVNLHVEPIEFNDTLKEKFLSSYESIIFTSGTIQTNNSFQSFINALGLEETGTKCVILPSTYDYKKQAQIFIPEDFPDVTKLNVQSYAEHVASFIYDTYTKLSKKIFVLLTSYEMLKYVHEALKEKDKHSEMILLTQGVTSGSREKLKKMFVNYEHAVLLGTNSFWEGFDLNDRQLKTVIMTRLPFDSPNDPLFRAKARLMKERKESVFYNLSLPQAILRFRQAFGRLIRNENDRGMLVVLDKRIMTKSYGTEIINSIPEVPIKYCKTDQLFNDAKNWISYTR
ncbi:helicase C-terminal domain-containing protein [Bacillaceae bacterium W0354]